MKVVWSSESLDRIIEIDAYISQDSPSAAVNLIEKIFSRADSLAEFPLLGRKVPEINSEDYRELIEGNYRIIYKIEKESISIATVMEGRRILKF